MLVPWLFHSRSHGKIVYAQDNNDKPPVVAPAPIMVPDAVKPLKPIKAPDFKPVEALETLLHSLAAPNTIPNTYAPGNCTYGVASRLPIPQDWGNANTWDDMARAQGYTVSNVPKVNAIAQTDGDSYLGHVAVVVAVHPDGSFDVWEENFGGLYSTDVRPTTTAEFPNFIYF
jgi:hypothetical protein